MRILVFILACLLGFSLLGLPSLVGRPATAAALLLNEYNAVREDKPLENDAADPALGDPAGTPVVGNGSRGAPVGERNDWFELVVVADELDVRGWQLELHEDGAATGTLELSDDPLWANLAAGTLVTIFEADDLAEDRTYDPASGDFDIAIRANDGSDGSLITARDFDVSNSDFQLTIRDARGREIFGPAGEGVAPESGIGSDEVFQLRTDPSALVTETSAEYLDSDDSSFSAPNPLSGRVQDLSPLREGRPFLDADFDGVADCRDRCRLHFDPAQSDGDADGFGDRCDPDYDGDGVVGLSDWNLLRAHLGRQLGDADFEARFDHDDDGEIGAGDIAQLSASFGGAPGPGPAADLRCDVSDPTEVLFDPDRLLEIDIEMPDASWQALRRETRSLLTASCDEVPPVSPYTYFPAEVTIDGTLLSNVGVRKKGFQGSLSTRRPSLKVDFTEFTSGLRFEGMDRLTLNNNKQDVSTVATCLAYHAMREAGVPAPRCNHARVRVNGQDLGIYSNVESIKKPFLSRSFGNNTGSLYEGTSSDFRRNFFGTFEIKEDGDRSELLALAHLLERSDAEIEAEIAGHIDVDAFIDFWVMEGLIGHFDGYNGANNNFYVYDDPDSALAFFPWGADQTFQTSTRGIVVLLESQLAQRLYAIPSFRGRYFDRLVLLRDQLFPPGGSAALLLELERMVSATVGPGTAAETLAGIDSVRDFLRNRGGDVELQIDFTDSDGDGLPDTAPEPGELAPRRFCFEDAGPIDVVFETRVIESQGTPTFSCDPPACAFLLFGSDPVEPDPPMLTGLDRITDPLGDDQLTLLLLAAREPLGVAASASFDPTLVGPLPATLGVPDTLATGRAVELDPDTGAVDPSSLGVLAGVQIHFDRFGTDLGDAAAGRMTATRLLFIEAPDQPLPPLPGTAPACGLGFELVGALLGVAALKRRRLPATRGRRSGLALWAAPLILLGAPAAEGLPLIDVVFVDLNGAPLAATERITAGPGDRVTVALRIQAGAEGVSSYSISMHYDLAATDGLDLLSITETTPAIYDVDLGVGALATIESTPGRLGEIQSVAAASTSTGLASSHFVISEAVFLIKRDGPLELRPLLAPGGIDGLFGSAGEDLAGRARFVSARVVPEPAILGPGVGLALGLLLAVRVARR